MKLIWQLIIGGIVGFFGALFLLSINYINFLKYSDIIVTILYLIAFILLMSGFVLNRQINRLNSQTFEGEEEDEAEVIKYRKFSDYSLFIQASTVISLLGVSIALITTMNIILIIIGLAYIIIGYFLQVFMLNVMQKVYPDRNLPSVSDPKYAEKLLDISDDGERHVMLHGLYKSYNLLNVLLVLAIVGSTFYSIITDNSQLFSIFLMSIVLLLTNGKYMLTIRNK